jgi:Tfp pilus assembly protein FimT
MGVIKFSDKNVNRSMKINGKDVVVDKVLANKQKFRVKQGEGQTVFDYDINDIDEVEGLIIDIV